MKEIFPFDFFQQKILEAGKNDKNPPVKIVFEFQLFKAYSHIIMSE